MDMNTILTEVIKALIIAVVPILLTLAGKLYTRVVEWIDAHVQNQYLLRVAHEAEQVVYAMGQSMAGPIKDAAADGKLTDEEKQRIKQAALDALKQRLLGYIPAALMSDARLGQAIEAAVGASKPADPRPAPESR